MKLVPGKIQVHIFDSTSCFRRSELEKFIREETQVADKILKGYDKRFVPTLPGN